ncbi:MAG: hypothetical protein FH762_13470 [Firmicutes bacterium]|nr:hypothetical protein [Bacillota bacterium]
MYKTPILIIVFCLVFVFATQSRAVEVGGELKVLLSGVLQDDGSLDSEFIESLNLEFFLPQIANNEIRYEFKIDKPLQDLQEGEELSYFAKKLYLKHRFDGFHLTLGRQPVSWSFGSLLNPVDYTLGSVALDEENNSKYTDALEMYIPLNWNSSLAIVSSFPAGFTSDFDKMKWGIRTRVGVSGYDLTINYVQEPELIFDENSFNNIIKGVSSIIPKKRAGFTIKGDLKDLGVYGSYGHYFDEGVAGSNSYLLGVDYSYNLNYYTTVNMQLEYLGIELNSLETVQDLFSGVDILNERINLLTGSMTYPIDDFSSISLTTMLNLDDSSFVLIPGYQSTLPGNIDLDISSSIFLGEEDSLFRAKGLMPKAVTTISLSYPF